MVMTEPFDKGSNSQVMELRGKLRYVRAVELNRFGKWSLELYPDAESLEKLRELQAEGVKNVIKKDDDGYHVQISRPPTVEFQKGVVQSVTPPKIRDSNKLPLPANVRIGDGSDGLVAIEVYTHRVPNTEKRAKAMRLYGIQVENLVPFEFNPEGITEEKENPKEGWD